MVPRVYAPLLLPGAAEVALPHDEATHLTRVLRLREGAAVRVFDGRGLEWSGTVLRAGRSAVTVAVAGVVASAPEPHVRITLAQALLKADKFDDVVRDATMLGVAAVRPLVTARTDVPASATKEGGRTDRWRRVAIASVKQCGRAVVPVVEPAAGLAACLAEDRSALRLILAEPALGEAAGLTSDIVAGAASVLLLVGPEGGWTDAEVAAARAAGCRPVTLGRRILRADAAPLVALSVLLHALGEL